MFETSLLFYETFLIPHYQRVRGCLHLGGCLLTLVFLAKPPKSCPPFVGVRGGGGLWGPNICCLPCRPGMPGRPAPNPQPMSWCGGGDTVLERGGWPFTGGGVGFDWAVASRGRPRHQPITIILVGPRPAAATHLPRIYLLTSLPVLPHEKPILGFPTPLLCLPLPGSLHKEGSQQPKEGINWPEKHQNEQTNTSMAPHAGQTAIHKKKTAWCENDWSLVGVGAGVC